MNFKFDYNLLEKEIEEKQFDILRGEHDNILIMLENILEEKLIKKGDKLSTYELLSYIKLKLNKPLESYYYGYESFKKYKNSLGIIIATIALLKINKEKAPKFIVKYSNDIRDCLNSTKFSEENFVEFFEFNSLLNILSLLEKNKNIINKKEFDFIENIGFYEMRNKDVEIKSYRGESLINIHLLKVADEYLILDCGAQIVNGEIEKGDLKNFLKGVNKEKIKGAIISHAHLDHYGSLDILYEYTNNVYMSSNTYELIKLVGDSEYIKEDKIKICENYIDFNIGSFIITAIPNGHILGSMAFYIKIKDKNFFYTGDFCFSNQNTVPGLKKRDIEMLIMEKGEIQYLITESTYGNKEEWLTYAQRKKLMKYFINLSYKKNIQVFIPAFAIGRAQECHSIINEEDSMYSLVDGLAKKVTEYYNKYSISSNLINTKTLSYEELSIEGRIKHSPIIITSSGMLQKKSMAMVYYEELLKRKMTTIIKCGYMDKEIVIKYLDRYDGLKINVIDINLSAHGQYDEIISLIKLIKPKNLIVVHGNGIRGIID